MKLLIITLFIAAFLSGCFLSGILSMYFCNKKIRAAYENILWKIDRILGGTMLETAYDESLGSAINERLNRLAGISQGRKEKAYKERDSIKAIISGISHQTRTPLANIMLYTGLLSEKELDSETKILADKIGKQAGKLDFFIKELFKSSYTIQEMVALHPEITEIEDIIDISCQQSELAALKKNICIIKEISPGLCYADKKWTIEALANILENAVKYSPDGSLVKVKTILYESFLCVSVEDEGIGISEEEQGLVFERFYRSKPARKEPGFGIGLYLVREILSKQGGYARIKSQPGKGTTVQIYLSRYQMQK
ncbi:MAG: HAMP domain-containing sensor histidine kinase [Lachnospiraceae bacterium]|nr:HAMP domain-containing sensor histidine kinase [Lachnospiraceae bacterium]